MRIKAAFIFCLVFASSGISVFAQNTHVGIVPKRPEFRKHIAVFSAFSYAVINNRKEIRGHYNPGINVGMGYWVKPWFFWTGEYTWFPEHSSSPGFENIKSWNTEFNGNLLMGTATSELKFRFIFGGTYLKWDGTYVGPDVVDDKTWYVGKSIHQEWIGANLGFGILRPVTKHFIAYGDFRLRFASQNKDLIGISDTSFSLGIQWHPLAYKVKVDKKSSSARPSRIYRWLKKRNS